MDKLDPRSSYMKEMLGQEYTRKMAGIIWFLLEKRLQKIMGGEKHTYFEDSVGGGVVKQVTPAMILNGELGEDLAFSLGESYVMEIEQLESDHPDPSEMFNEAVAGIKRGSMDREMKRALKELGRGGRVASEDFYQDYAGVFSAPSVIDSFLQGRDLRGVTAGSLSELTDRGRAANALHLPVEAGARVAFVYNLGSVLTYPSIPNEGVSGTVVVVRSANGDATSYEGRVMVAWDDGVFRPILAEHLRQAGLKTKQAQSMALRVSCLGDLSSLFGPTRNGSSDLIHRATKDLWSFRKDAEGYVIERLFNEDGNPLKV